jgi:D-hydroxyproline dehydrogenase subunit gamma
MVPIKAAAVRSPGQRGCSVTFLWNSKRIEAYDGEMLAAALMAAGILTLRSSPRAGAPRGAFCLMGVCQECLVRIDGQVRQSCLVAVRDGLAAEAAILPGADA